MNEILNFLFSITMDSICWVWRPKAVEWVSHPPWRAISFLHPEELEACIPAS
jgi:hypothetical protein